MNSKLEWLLKCADHLTANSRSGASINVITILHSLSISLQYSFLPDRITRGILTRTTDNSYSIIINRRERSNKPLLNQERFTIAHEIAHYLLIKQYKWNPLKGDDLEQVEAFCNDFAGRLLVPPQSTKALIFDSGLTLFGSLKSLQKRLKVSWRVLGLQVPKYQPNIAICLSAMRPSKTENLRIRCLWGSSSCKDMPWNTGRYVITNTAFDIGFRAAWRGATENGYSSVNQLSYSIYSSKDPIFGGNILTCALKRQPPLE